MAELIIPRGVYEELEQFEKKRTQLLDKKINALEKAPSFPDFIIKDRFFGAETKSLEIYLPSLDLEGFVYLRNKKSYVSFQVNKKARNIPANKFIHWNALMEKLNKEPSIRLRILGHTYVR